MGGDLLSGGRIALSCVAVGGSGMQVVVYDLLHDTVVWQADLSSYGVTGFAGTHLLLISSTTAPAQGLEGASTSYTLTARNLATGAIDWQANMGTTDPTQNTSFAEGPSGVPGHANDVVISSRGGTSAYDASTGAPVWHTKNTYLSEASGGYVTDNIVEVNGYQDNDYGQHLTGLDAQTGHVAWDLRLPSACGPDTAGVYLMGATEWQFGSSCFEEHNVGGGHLIAEQQFPSSWQNVASSPAGIAEYDGTNLALYKVTDLKAAVWTEKAGDTTPRAVSSGHILVDAPSGTLVLSGTDGSITAHVPTSFDDGSLVTQGLGGGYVTDGLVEAISEGGDTAVLELDAPQRSSG